MILEYIIASLVAVLSIINLIISRNTKNIIKSSFGFLVALFVIPFAIIDMLKPYILLYDALGLLYAIFISLFLIPKRITKNLTEYDYFELDKAYTDLKDEREKLRERYLSTISLIDEGVIFYENNFSTLFYSDRAQELFGKEPSRSFDEHVSQIEPSDREDYKRTIDHLTKRGVEYDIKYRITRGQQKFWVEERGHFIDVGGKKSIISTVKPLDPAIFQKSGFFEIDSIYTEDRLYPLLNNLVGIHKKFSLIMVELSNIPDMNKKYGRAVGSLMINEYIKFLKASYQKDVTKIFRITGLTFVMIIDDDLTYDNFHRSLVDPKSELYNIKLHIATIKDTIKPNFGVVNVSQMSNIEPKDLLKISERTLEDAKESSRKDFAIFGE